MKRTFICNRETCKKEFVRVYYNANANRFCNNFCATLHVSEERKKKFFAGDLKRIERTTARRYLAEQYGYKCSVCEISEWQGKKLMLQVDHINGDPGNDHPSNLRLICPNCHSQTEFLGAANKGRGRAAQGLPLR